jgi:RNA polymerase sigma factor (sigma-70 family)
LKDIEELYTMHSKNVYYYAFSLCHNQDIALDIMQSTFLSAIISKNNYNGTCSITTWLFSIAKHEFYKHLSKNKNQIGLDEIIYLSITENIDDKMQIKEEKKILYETINFLDEKLKNIVLLRILYNLSFSEISCIVEKSEVYCRVNFYRAKQKIINILNLGGLINE